MENQKAVLFEKNSFRKELSKRTEYIFRKELWQGNYSGVLTGILRTDVSKMLSAFNFGEKANKVSGIFNSTKTPLPTVADFIISKFWRINEQEVKGTVMYKKVSAKRILSGMFCTLIFIK